jgi:cell surface protein SprA
MTQFKNINLMNVRKERVAKKNKRSDDKSQDPGTSNRRDPNNMSRGGNMPTVHIYDIENFNFSFAYSETNQENTDIEYFNVKTYRGSLGYNYVGNPKNVAPFASKKWASKSYLALIKDFNFYYLPKSMSFNTEMYRYYSEKLMRNKSGGEIIINPTYSKQWDWNRNYQFRYDLTRGLNLDYSAEAQAYIYEPAGHPDQGTAEWTMYQDTIKNELRHLGSMSRFHQTVNVNYTVPINKLPLLNWVTASASYQGQYFWTASAQSIQSRLGNTIENTHSIQGNATLDFTKIYNSVPYLKKLNAPASRRGNNQRGKDAKGKDTKKGKDDNKGQVSDSTTMKSSVNVGKVLLDGGLKILTMVKKVSGTYSVNGGQILPGFMPTPDWVGLSGTNGAPGWEFVAGLPHSIYGDAVANGWLTTDSILSQPYVRRNTETISYRINCEPFSGFKFDIQGNRNYADNYQHYFRANPMGEFEIFTPTNGGNFTASTMLLRTAFQVNYDADDNESTLFDQMLANRAVIADRIAQNNPQWVEHVQNYYFDTIAGAYFPQGYGASNMDVLLYSFLSAYSGQDASSISLTPFQKIPFPNWSITYNGLTNIPAIGAIFKTINLTHNYRSTYTISNWASNVYYNENNPIQTFENSTNIISKYDITQVMLNEQFMPLFGIDMGFQNSLTANFQYKKSRALTMSFSNNQLTEVNGRELVFGAGYRIKGLSFNITSMTGNKGKKTIKNDLVLKLDIGFKYDKTVLRRIDERNSQVSAGQNKINVYLTADYQFSTRLSAQAFFKRDMNNPFISTSFPTSSTFAGVLIRFNLAQ